MFISMLLFPLSKHNIINYLPNYCQSFIIVSPITVSISQEIQRVQRVPLQWDILRRISERGYLIKVWAGLGGRAEWRATGIGWLAPQGPEGARKEAIIGT